MMKEPADGSRHPGNKLNMYPQTEYGLAYALIIGLVVLGLLVVCIPRPRKKDIIDPAEAARNKRRRMPGSPY